MKILFHSNSPWTHTGYGAQTEIFTRRMAAEGHDIVISAFYGLQAAQLQIHPQIRVLPSDNGDYGQHDLVHHYEHLNPDAVIALMDVWVLHPPTLAKLPTITSWCPVDHQPIPPNVIDRLARCRHVWAMSRFGLRQMRDHGITDAWYVPHGVDTKQSFYPADRQEARTALGLPDDAFVVTCAAANKGFPSRKNLPALLKAWGAFVKAHSDAVLVLHSDPRATLSQLDLLYISRFYGIPANNIVFPDPYTLDIGGYTAKHMNWLYNAGDVFCLPSAGEGFGIPAIEAQAAGSPVILTNFSAQAELCAPGGWLIDVDPFNDLVYTPQLSEQAAVPAGRILQALKQAYEARGDALRRTEARRFAEQYDADRVYERYMKPAIMAQAGEDDAARAARRETLRGLPFGQADIEYLAQQGVQVGAPPTVQFDEAMFRDMLKRGMGTESGQYASFPPEYYEWLASSTNGVKEMEAAGGC